jgi:hypothetical protein
VILAVALFRSLFCRERIPPLLINVGGGIEFRSIDRGHRLGVHLPWPAGPDNADVQYLFHSSQGAAVSRPLCILVDGPETASPCYISILARCFFKSPRLRFDSRIFRLSAGGRSDR